MKKLLVLALVLSMATMANAALTLSVSSTDLAPSGTAVISISGDGLTDPGMFYVGVIGAGSLNIETATVLYPANATAIFFEDLGGALGTNEPLVHIELNGVPPVGQTNPPLTGLLVNNIIIHGDAAGIITVALFDGGGTQLDSKEVTVSDVPEPITIGLLGLGAMFLRRKK
jgi:hypothetical protein